MALQRQLLFALYCGATAETIRIEPKYQYVEGVAAENERQWVIAAHPRGRPEAKLAEEALNAFEELAR